MTKKTEIDYLKEFLNSNCTNYGVFEKLCKNNPNLTIYLCIGTERLNKVFETIKTIQNPREQYNYLINNQPSINESEEIFIKAVDYLAEYLKPYIKYHAFKLVNAYGDMSDYVQDLYQKLYYMTNFYKDRWFHINELKKSTKVKWRLMKYKEFSYIARATISGERRLKAYKFAKTPEASINKISLNQSAYTNPTELNDKSIKREDLLCQNYEEKDECNYNNMINKACYYAKTLERGKYAKKLTEMLHDTQIKGNKIENTLLKVCLYKAGFVNSSKLLNFINELSDKYKEKFGISQTLLNKHIDDNIEYVASLNRLAINRVDCIYEYRDRLIEEAKNSKF